MNPTLTEKRYFHFALGYETDVNRKARRYFHFVCVGLMM